MSVNKEAVKEIFARDGYNAAKLYLTNHEAMTNDDADAYLLDNIPPEHSKVTEETPVYYCETHKELTLTPCPSCNTTKFSKVKSFIISLKTRSKYYFQ